MEWAEGMKWVTGMCVAGGGQGAVIHGGQGRPGYNILTETWEGKEKDLQIPGASVFQKVGALRTRVLPGYSKTSKGSVAGEGKGGAQSKEMKWKAGSWQNVWSTVWTFDCALGEMGRWAAVG